jgi:hypothetical protein
MPCLSVRARARVTARKLKPGSAASKPPPAPPPSLTLPFPPFWLSSSPRHPQPISTCVSRQQPRQVQPAQPPNMEARTLGCQTICHPARPIASRPSHLSQERQCAQSPPPLRPPPPRHGRLLHALPWRGPPIRPGKTLSAPPAYESASAGDLTEIKDHLLDILRSNRLADLPLSVPPPPPPCVPPPDYIPPPPPDPPPQSRPSQYLGEEHVEDAGVVHGFVYDEEYAFDRARDHHVASPVDDGKRERERERELCMFLGCMGSRCMTRYAAEQTRVCPLLLLIRMCVCAEQRRAPVAPRRRLSQGRRLSLLKGRGKGL